MAGTGAGQDVSPSCLPARPLRAGPSLPAIPDGRREPRSRAAAGRAGRKPGQGCGAARGSALAVLRPALRACSALRLGRAPQFRLQRKLGPRPAVRSGYRPRAAQGRAGARPHCRRDRKGSAGPEGLAPARAELSRTFVPTKIPAGEQAGGGDEGRLPVQWAVPRRQGHREARQTARASVRGSAGAALPRGGTRGRGGLRGSPPLLGPGQLPWAARAGREPP